MSAESNNKVSGMNERGDEGGAEHGITRAELHAELTPFLGGSF